jgi:hypothetical protein
LDDGEVSTVVAFVRNGGGLCVFGDAGLSESINRLLGQFGIAFRGNVVFEPHAAGVDGGNPVVRAFIHHPALPTSPEFAMNWGGWLQVSSPALALGFSDNATWIDVNRNGSPDPGEPRGPCAAVAAASFGAGRVFCVSDNSFHDDFLKYRPASGDFLLSVLRWLTEAVRSGPVNRMVPLTPEAAVLTPGLRD